MNFGTRRKIIHCVERQTHQTGEEEHGKTENRINQFLFGQQVHQEAGDQKRVDARHAQYHRHFDRPSVMGWQVGDENHQRDRAQHADENIDAAVQVTFEIDGM